MSLIALMRARVKPRELFYGWYIVLAGALSNFLILGVTIFGFGVFIEPIREELGWSVQAIGIGFSIRSLETGLLSPFTGHLIDRLGARRMAVTGVILVVGGLLLFSQAHDLWVYYASSSILAVGQSLGGLNSFTLAIMTWFNKKRGRAMGMLHTGNGFAYFMVLILAAMISAFGWRETLLISAAVIFAFGIPLALVIRPRPEAYGYLPDGERLRDADGPALQEQPRARAAPSATGMTVAEAVRTPTFYLLALAGAAGNVVMVSWIVFQIPHLENSGFSLRAAGAIVAIYGGLQIALRFSVGWLGDVIGRRRMYMGSYLLMGVGLWAFATLSPSRIWLLPLYYLTFGMGHAAWLVTFQTIVADYFGTKRYATNRGLVQTLQMPVGVGAPVFVGWMFDRNGSYDMAFLVLAAICATGTLWVFLIRRPEWNVIQSAAPAAAPAAEPAGR